jgi:hypothetical protein
MPAILIYSLFIVYIYLLIFSACSGSMREVSSGSTMLAIIIHHLYIYWYLVPAAAACGRRLAAARCLRLLYLFIIYYVVVFIYLLFIIIYLFILWCLQRQRVGGILRQHDACHYNLFTYYILCIYSLHIIHLLYSTSDSSMHEVSCGNTMPAIIMIYCFIY